MCMLLLCSCFASSLSSWQETFWVQATKFKQKILYRFLGTLPFFAKALALHHRTLSIQIPWAGERPWCTRRDARVSPRLPPCLMLAVSVFSSLLAVNCVVSMLQITLDELARAGNEYMTVPNGHLSSFQSPKLLKPWGAGSYLTIFIPKRRGNSGKSILPFGMDLMDFMEASSCYQSSGLSGFLAVCHGGTLDKVSPSFLV